MRRLGVMTCLFVAAMAAATPSFGQCTLDPAKILPNGIVGVDYSTILTPGGGESPYDLVRDEKAPPPEKLELFNDRGVWKLQGVPAEARDYQFTVLLSDSSKRCLNQRFDYTLRICPELIFGELPAATLGETYRELIPIKGGSGEFTFRLPEGERLPDGLLLDSRGTVSGDPKAEGSYAFKIEITDAVSGCVYVQPFTINVCPRITVSTTDSLTATVGKAHSITFLASPAAATMALSGAPAGMTFDGKALSGTPASAGTYPLTVLATASGCSKSYPFTLQVNCPTISGGVIPTSATVGSFYSATLSASGGTAPYTFATSGTLPPGIVLNGGRIEGTPNTPGTFSFTVRATDVNGCIGDTAHTITVACPRFTFGTYPEGKVGVEYSHALDVRGGVPPYLFELKGVLPEGLVFDSGKIAGIPRVAGSFPLTVGAMDQNKCSDSTSLTLLIAKADCEPIVIATPPNGQVAVGYSHTLAAKGGSGIYTFSVTGTLPPGLTFDGKAIAGTPKEAGSFDVQITATDQNGCVGSGKFSILIEKEICPSMTLGPAAFANGTVAQKYEALLTATGGTAPHTFTISSGGLPAGLTLSGAAISGVPTAAGTSTFTVAATDARGCSGSKSFTITIDPPACPTISISPSALSGGQVGSDYKVGVIASGGLAPYTYAVTSGALPLGLTLSGDVISGTPTTAGSYRFVVTATDANRCSGSRSYTVDIAAACSTAAATPVSPESGVEVDGAKPITFSWKGIDNAKSYDVLVSTDSTTFSAVASTTGMTATASLPAGSYVWVIRTNFGPDCKSTVSTASKLVVRAETRCPTTKASLVSPRNGSTDVERSVLFEWLPVEGAIDYTLLLSVNGSSTSKVATTTGTRLKFEVPEGTIGWAITTAFSGCPATVSETFSFKTKPASTCPANPTRPTLIAPANNSSDVASPVTFSWNSVAGASEYRLYTWHNGVASATVTTTSTTHQEKFSAGTVVWLVEATFAGCPTTVLSDKWTFSISAGATCETSAPALLTPANGAASVLSPVTFSWNAVPHAVGYQLFFAIGDDRLVEAVTTRATSHTQSISTTGRVLWQVVALFSGCDPVKSDVWSFTLVSPKTCPEGTIALRSPADGSTVPSPVTFSWTPVSGATEYRVLYSVNGASSVVKSATPSATASIEKGTVKWVVEALVESGCKPIVSAAGEFTVQPAQTCETNTPPVIQSPVGAPGNPIEFTGAVPLRWAAAAGATSYRVWLSVDGKAAEDFETTATSVERTLAPGNYAWFVAAQFPGCSPLPSATGYFRVNREEPRCGDQTPGIVAPADGSTAVPANVTLLWSAVDKAISYRVYAALRGDSSAPAEFKLLEETKATSSVQVLPPGEVIWYVEAVFSGCPSTVSSRASFFIGEIVNCTPELPDPIAPRDGAESIESPVTFSWSPVSGAIEYVVVAQNVTGHPTPVGRTRGETSLTRHMPAGSTIEWFVVAMRAGCKPATSATSRFTTASPPACDAPAPQITGPLTRSALSNPVHLSWTASTGATGYRVWAMINDRPSLIATPSGTDTVATMPEGRSEWYVEAVFDNCQPLRSGTSVIDIAPPAQSCGQPAKPEITVIGQALSNTPYIVRWAPLQKVSVYELQESSSGNDFSQAATFVIQGTPQREFVYSAATALRKFYRVRGLSDCSDEKGPYSEIVGVHIVPVNTLEQRIPGTAEMGVQQTIVQTVFVAGGEQPVSFTARTDQPWVRVSPESGILPPEGLTFTLSADPSTIGLGANTATLLLTYGNGARVGTKDTKPQPTSVPVSVSLVTPVGASGKNSPLADSLIIPAVGHAPGANNSLFQSDVRVANTSTQPMTYQLNFTPSGTDGTVTGSSTTIQVAPGATIALNDVLASFFGTGPNGSAIGVLEIRPLTASTTSAAATTSLATPTIASSRTYNVTAGGTLGQYIPAIPFSKFVGQVAGSSSRPVLSMQQIAESPNFRTNLGLVEGSGNPAEVLIRIFDASGNLLGDMAESLRPFEHKQLNSIAGRFGLQLEDGRIEVEVTSPTGRVTAYASRQDNKTNDPLLVQPVLKDAVQSTRYVVPGIAYIDGLAKWRSDVRIFNAGSTATAATLTYFPQGNPAGAMSKQVTINDGQVLALDNILHEFFGINDTSAGGSLLVSTPAPSSIIATARTYADSDNGTYGLFAPGVSPEEAVGVGQKSLHLLQLEHSSAFRTNIGLVETSGKDAVVEVSLILPGSKVTPRVQFPMRANEFLQFPLSAFNAGNAVYNARAVVKVLSGGGRVSAYGSVVDNATNDSTYVPAQ